MILTTETLIQNTQALQQFCETLSFDPGIPPFLAIDTEFIRERSYWPHLCLIQVADACRTVAIDPLAPDLDLSPFLALLQTPDILKVFHSGRQDIEIFYLLTGQIPAPLFDTQVAAMACGFGDSVSYENLVQSILKKRVDKAFRLTDWSRRPLTPEQLRYALGDVHFLRKLYGWFYEELKKNKREDWICQEMALLSTPATYQTLPENAWTRLKGASPQALKPLSFTVLKALAALREQVAQDKNIPRRRVIRDEIIFELATALPTTVDALKQLRGIATALHPDLPAEKIVEHIAAICQQSSTTWEKALQSANPPSPDKDVLALLRLLLKMCADGHGLAQRLIATNEDLEFFAREKGKALEASPLLQGWRFDVFGKEALDLKMGRLALTLLNGKIHRVPLESPCSESVTA